MATAATIIVEAVTGSNADTNGTWLDVRNFEFPLAIITIGSGASDTIIINATAQFPLPANSTHDQQIASLSADAITYINGPVAGIKARTGASKTQSSTVYLFGRVKRD